MNQSVQIPWSSNISGVHTNQSVLSVWLTLLRCPQSYGTHCNSQPEIQKINDMLENDLQK